MKFKFLIAAAAASGALAAAAPRTAKARDKPVINTNLVKD